MVDMRVRIGPYELRPSKIPNAIKHRLDHIANPHWAARWAGAFGYSVSVDDYGSYPFATITNHRKEYPEGSYEFLLKVDD